MRGRHQLDDRLLADGVERGMFVLEERLGRLLSLQRWVAGSEVSQVTRMLVFFAIAVLSFFLAITRS
jgi:hypothetical protein